MNILATGASGFIASQIVTDLINEGHSVTCCVRNKTYTQNLFPTANVLTCNFSKDVTSEVWLPRLKNIDIVINCVGILYHPNKKVIWDIHHAAPCALFDACVQAGVQKIIQLSALGVDKSDVEYAKSKKAAEDHLLTLPINSIILRPSLVYGRGSYGGTSLFRGLSAMPWMIPVPGKGTQEFQPIYLQDLSKAILQLIKKPIKQTVILSAVSTQRITLSDILTKMRAWLGFKKAKLLFIPLWMIRLGAYFGDLIPYSAMNTTSYKMLAQNNITTTEEANKFHHQIDFVPRDFAEGLRSQPSTVQDHWHARLFFLKSLLQISIAFVFIFTAICSVFIFPQADAYQLLTTMGVTSFWQPILLYGASTLNMLLGLAMLVGYQLKKVCSLQILFILIYTAIITWKLPSLWVDPFGPISKNIPLMISILVFLAMESDR